MSLQVEKLEKNMANLTITVSAEDFNNLLADVKQTWRGKNVSPNG